MVFLDFPAKKQGFPMFFLGKNEGFVVFGTQKRFGSTFHFSSSCFFCFPKGPSTS